MYTLIPHIHIGRILTTYINKKRASRAELGRVTGLSSASINYYLRQQSLSTDTLQTFCHALKHNFFADIAAKLPETYSTSVPPDTTKDERIAALEEEVKLLKAEKEVLMALMKK